MKYSNNGAKAAQEPTLPGKVTKIKQQARNSTRVSVFLDGAFAFGCHSDAIREFRVSTGSLVTEDIHKKLLTFDESIRAREYFIRLLSGRDYSKVDLRRKALQKGFALDAIEPVLASLEEKGYLNEERYARTFMQNAIDRKKWGENRIRLEARKKGLNGSLIEKHLSDLNPSDISEGMAVLVQKNSRRLKAEMDILKRRKKIFDHLAYRGYKASDIMENMDHLLEITQRE